MVIFFSSKKLSQCLCMIASEKKPYTVTYYYLVLIRSAIQAPGQLIILIKKHFQ
jgi:hypothetical protein